ncbi:hypothetical protein CYMTET_42787 [Cymbomonas tetramitiformis]|uniref:Uncharacterized protein n=1 Tax=Cymbomonas tetramitiformis TaxID=36881 RepID=A0AAE0C5K8_9CHLO|nr:hypothetical protein CYMTET_42787 [Cymbomonas tetramitiformis]
MPIDQMSEASVSISGAEQPSIASVLASAWNDFSDKLKASLQDSDEIPPSDTSLDSAFDNLDLRRLPSITQQRKARYGALGSGPSEPSNKEATTSRSKTEEQQQELDKCNDKILALQRKLTAADAMINAQATSLEEQEKVLKEAGRKLKQLLQDHEQEKKTWEEQMEEERELRRAAEEKAGIMESSRAKRKPKSKVLWEPTDDKVEMVAVQGGPLLAAGRDESHVSL